MQIHPRKLDKLKKRLQKPLEQANFQWYRDTIQQVSSDLDIDVLDCAASLLVISQPHLFQNLQPISTPEIPSQNLPLKPKTATHRNVRYRLDVGTQHQVDREQLFALIIEESGVDRKSIARADIRDTYTLVDLPEGMPADIFQLLSEATLNGHPLNIKRVKSNRKKFRVARRGNEQTA